MHHVTTILRAHRVRQVDCSSQKEGCVGNATCAAQNFTDPNRFWNLATSTSRTTHTSECLSSSRKNNTEAATHPSQQPDDANCSHHHVKQITASPVTTTAFQGGETDALREFAKTTNSNGLVRPSTLHISFATDDHKQTGRRRQNTNVSSHTSLNATNFYGSSDGQNMNASVRLSPVQTRDVPKKEH